MTDKMKDIVDDTMNHLLKLQGIGEETFGEKLWKPEIHLLELLLREYND